MGRKSGYHPKRDRSRCTALVTDRVTKIDHRCYNSAPHGATVCGCHVDAATMTVASNIFIQAHIYPPRRNREGIAQPVFIAKVFPSRDAAIHFINQARPKIARICRGGEQLNALSIRAF